MTATNGPDPSARDDSADWLLYATDLLSSVGSVLLVGLLLFAVSGVWPPLVAIESESMEPNMHAGDLVFVMEENRFPGEDAHSTGVVTARTGVDAGYSTFDRPGDVIVYAPDGNTRSTPIIHRAMFWVDEGENWYDEADSSFVGGADRCEQLRHCPAPHAGFVTKGDNPRTNDRYDQVQGISAPVKPAWVVGTAEARVPWLGCIRLRASGVPLRPGACELPLV